MILDAALTTWLKGRTSIAALVGTRVYPLSQEQGAENPKLTWTVTGADQPVDIGGASLGLTKVSLEFGCRAVTLAGANAVADALRTEIRAFFRGDLTGVFVQGFLLSPEGARRDDRDPPVHAEEAGTALVTVEARVTYEG